LCFRKDQLEIFYGARLFGEVLSLQGNDIILHPGSSLDVSGGGFSAELGPGRGIRVSNFFLRHLTYYHAHDTTKLKGCPALSSFILRILSQMYFLSRQRWLYQIRTPRQDCDDNFYSTICEFSLLNGFYMTALKIFI